MSVTDASEKVEISVLVPVMNEAGNIRPLMNEIAAVLSGAHLKSFISMMAVQIIPLVSLQMQAQIYPNCVF